MRKQFDAIVKDIERVTCPCCGYPTLEERNGYEICELCNWEDDGQDDEDASVIRGGPNGGYSLAQARDNFQKYQTMYSPGKNTTITGPDSAEREALKTELMNTFESMLSNPEKSDSEKNDSLWNRVVELEKLLYGELRKSIEQYEEAQAKKP